MHLDHISTFILLAFNITLALALQGDIPKIVWVYVEDTQSLNEFEKLSLNNVQHYASQSKYELRVVTDSNYITYVTNNEEWQKISARQFLDKSILKKAFIQLTILLKYGGIWIDIPIILTQSFQWLQTIKNQRHINNRIDQPNTILFYSPQWFQQTFKRTSIKIEDLVIYPKYHSWFLVTVQNNTLINDWRKIFIDIMFKDQKDARNFYKLYELDPKEFLINPLVYLDWTLQATIKIKQNQLDKHYGTVSSVRRLAINQYKISGIDAQQTAYLLDQQAKHHTHLITKYFTEVPVKDFTFKFSYLLKTTRQVEDEITSILDQQIPLNEHLHSSVSLVCQGGKVPFRHVIQSSIMDEYLIKIKEPSTLKRYSPQFIKHHCSVTYQSVFFDFILYYVAPLGAAVGQIYIVRRMLLIFKPEWGLSRRMV